MKSISQRRLFDQSLRNLAVAGAILMSTSAGAFAQTMPDPPTHRVTRAEVMHELYELEAAGYNPSQGDDGSYPADLQAAQEKVAAKHRAEQNALMSAGQNGQVKPAP